jgi:hypothetical protein
MNKRGAVVLLGDENCNTGVALKGDVPTREFLANQKENSRGSARNSTVYQFLYDDPEFQVFHPKL